MGNQFRVEVRDSCEQLQQRLPESSYWRDQRKGTDAQMDQNQSGSYNS
jgi:hypothetical protein